MTDNEGRGSRGVAGALIRVESAEDRAAVRDVNRAAFPTSDEADLVDALRNTEAWIPAFSFVAEVDGRVVGHLLLTRAALVADDGTEHPILTLAPMAVLPEWQGRGVGSALVRAAIERATAAGEPLVTVLGHPWFYPTFGFRRAREQGIEAPRPWRDASWMALPLNPAGAALRGRVRFAAPFDPLL